MVNSTKQNILNTFPKIVSDEIISDATDSESKEFTKDPFNIPYFYIVSHYVNSSLNNYGTL